MSKEIKKLKQQVDTQGDLIQDIYERQKKFLHKLCEFEEITGINEGIKKTHNESAEHLKAVIEVVNGTGWFLPDAMEVLCEINSQGFSYPESINILKEVLHIVNTDYQLDWRRELAKIIEKKESFCCSWMAEAVKGKVFKPIYYDTDLTRIEYYSFNFRVDSNYSVSAIIHYCPFCGKKIGVRIKDSIVEKPLCTEICADPDLVEVIDSVKETEEVRQREWKRVMNCPLKTKYECQWAHKKR